MKPDSSRRLPAVALVLWIGLCVPAWGQTLPSAVPQDILVNLKEGVWVGRVGSNEYLDEPLVFRSETGTDAVTLRVQLSPATADDASDTVQLYLVPGGDGALALPNQIVETQTGASPQEIKIQAGRRSFARLVGGRFSYPWKTYRARLVAQPLDSTGKPEPRAYFYPIVIEPQTSLGLKARALEPDEQEVLPGQTGSVDACIEAAYLDRGKPNILLQPPNPLVEGARPLLPSQVTLSLSHEKCKDGLFLTFHDLPRGRYASLMTVNGEPLVVKLTLKYPWWVVPLLIFIGAMISVLIRETLRILQRRSDVHSRMAGIRDELDERERLTEWDDLRARNALRRAEGYLGLLDLPELEAALKESKRDPDGHPEIAFIRRMLVETPLPKDIKDEVERDLRAITRTSSAADARRTSDLLAVLKKRADNGFRGDLLAWVDRLQSHASKRRQDLTATVQQNPLLGRALDTLDQLVLDAEHLLLAGTPLDPQQVVLLEAIPGTLDALVSADKKGSLSKDLLNELAHAVLPTGQPLSLAPAPSLPPGLQAQIKVTPEEVTALQAVTFGLDFTPTLSPEDLKLVRIRWEVEGDDHPVDGGPQLTYLFSGRSKKPPAVTATFQVPGGALAPRPARWALDALAVQPTPSRRSAFQLWVTRQAATFVAVAVTSVFAIALYWSDKPFGGWADSISMLAIGLGADAALVGGGGQLLGKVMGSLGLGTKEGNA